MPELENKRHEEFVKTLADPESPSFLNQSKSYSAIYKDANGSAQPQSSRLLSNDIVKDRFLELMERHGLTDDNLAKRHAEILEKGEDSVALKAIITGHQLKGRLLNRINPNDRVNLAMTLNVTVSPSSDKQSIDVKPDSVTTNEQ